MFLPSIINQYAGTVGGDSSALSPFGGKSPAAVQTWMQTIQSIFGEKLTAFTLKNSALEEEMQLCKIMYARRNTEYDHLHTEYDLLLQERNALQQTLEQRPEAIKRLEQTWSDATKPHVSNLLNGMKHFVGDSIVQLQTDGDSATFKIALEEMAAPFPKHVEMMTTIQATKEHMLEPPTATSAGDKVKGWPDREAVDALGLLPVLQTAVHDVEEAAFPKLIAALNMIPTGKANTLQSIEAEVKQQISSATAAAPKLKAQLDTIEAVFLESIKSKEAAVEVYKAHCQQYLGVCGLESNFIPPTKLPRDAKMSQLHILETILLQTAEMRQSKYYEVTHAALQTPLKSATELQDRFTQVKKYFKDDTAKRFVRRYNKVDLDATIKLCNTCSTGTYAAERKACNFLADLSPDMKLVVKEHEEYLEDIELAADEGNGAKVRTDALARLQAQANGCKKCSKTTVDTIITQLFKKLEADADKGMPSAIDDIAYLQETVTDLPKAPWYFSLISLFIPDNSVNGKIDAIVKAAKVCTPEQREQLPTFVRKAEATKWVQDLKAAEATKTVHELVKLLVAPPSHSASEADVKGAADQCWATIPTTIKDGAVQVIFAQCLDGIRDHLSTILTLKESRPALPGLDVVVETLQEAARLLAQPPSSMTTYLDGWNVHHAIVLTPEEAKFGCTVEASRLGGSSDVVIVPGAVDLTREAQSIVEHGKGLRDFQPQHSDASYGDLVLHVTVSGRPETKPLPSGAKVFASSKTGNKRPKKATSISGIDSAQGCVHKLACSNAVLSGGGGGGGGGGGAAAAAGDSSLDAADCSVPPPPVIKGQEARDAVSSAVASLCSFVPTADIIDAFKHGTGCASDASASDVGRTYSKAAKRATANITFEFRHEDRGGDQAKAVFLLESQALLFPSNAEEEARHAAYNGLCARLVPGRTPAEVPRLGTSEPFREDVNVLITKFIDVNGGLAEVAPVTRKMNRHSTAFDFNAGGAAVPTHSSTTVKAGKGEAHDTYPWRGDVVEEIVVSDTTVCTINGTECTISRRTLQWDLQVEHVLSSYEACVGSAALELAHPDGGTYCMQLQAAQCSTDDSGDGSTFAEGCYVYVAAGLGAATCTAGRGDLYIVLRSNLTL